MEETLSQRSFDRVEVRQIAGAFEDFGVLDGSVAIDDEGRTFRDTAHGEIFLGEETVVGKAVGFGDVVFVVAEKRDRDAFFLGPVALRKGIVAADAKDFRAETFVFAETFAHGAKLRRADAGEGHGEKEEHDL